MQILLSTPRIAFGSLLLCFATCFTPTDADDRAVTPVPEPVIPDAEPAEDEIWLFNTRQLGCADMQTDHVDFRVSRVDEFGDTTPADYADFIATDRPERLTLVYVHGNRNTYSQSLYYGMQTYRRLIACHPESRPPIRFVIWSWPSSQIKGPIRDVRVKAARADVDAYFLATFLNRLSPETPVSLLGFSYGARILTGALHSLSGAPICGRSVPVHVEAERSLRLVMIAAALHNDWPCPGHRHGNAFTDVDHLLNIYNDRDPALKRYRFVSHSSQPQALGYTGLPAACRICPYRQINASCIVGRTHDIRYYINSSSLRARIRSVLVPHRYPLVDGSSANSLFAETSIRSVYMVEARRDG